VLRTRNEEGEMGVEAVAESEACENWRASGCANAMTKSPRRNRSAQGISGSIRCSKLRLAGRPAILRNNQRTDVHRLKIRQRKAPQTGKI
jgi:hypothetical protein